MSLKYERLPGKTGVLTGMVSLVSRFLRNTFTVFPLTLLIIKPIRSELLWTESS